MKEQKEVRFTNLSVALKILVILGWIYTGIFALSFVVGFLEGLIGI